MRMTKKNCFAAITYLPGVRVWTEYQRRRQATSKLVANVKERRHSDKRLASARGIAEEKAGLWRVCRMSHLNAPVQSMSHGGARTTEICIRGTQDSHNASYWRSLRPLRDFMHEPAVRNA